jgi:isoaspartyl peptidase/L-asparaginase-like protein (Ntn-hydrolase superfamily)
LRGGTSAADAVRHAIEDLEVRAGATGGLIAVDRFGRLALARTTETMSWAALWCGSEPLCGT